MSRRIHGGKARGILVAVAVAAGVAWSAQAAGAAPTQVPCYQDGGSLSCPSLAPGPTVTKTVTKTAAPTVTKTVTKTKTVTASASPSAVPTSATPSTPVPGVGEDACTDPNLTPVPVPADGLVPSQVLDLNPWYEGVPVETLMN